MGRDPEDMGKGKGKTGSGARVGVRDDRTPNPSPISHGGRKNANKCPMKIHW